MSDKNLTKLSIEPDLLSVESPSSLIPLIVDINSLLDDQALQCLRKINFMSYEIATQCDNYVESDRLHILNDYFFSTQHFQIHKEKCHKLWNIHHVIDQKQGAPLPIALIYLHLATYIDLPFYLIQLQEFRMIKWPLGKHSKYINLADQGRILDEKQILNILNETTPTRLDSDPPETQLEIIPTKDLLLHYVQSLIEIYKHEKKEPEQKMMLDVVLKISPSNLNSLKERALLLKKIGHYEEALNDIKKYFSFTSLDDSPQDVKMAFQELKSNHLRPISPSPH